MIVCDAACAVLTAGMAVRGVPVAVAAVLLFAVTLLNSPFTAARAALTRDVFGDDRYTAAVAVNTFTTRAALAAGFAAGGLLVATVGARGALLIDAATFAVSAVLIRLTVTNRPAARPAENGPRPGWAADLTAGVRAVFADPRLRTLTLFAWLAAFHVAPYGVVVPYAAEHGGGPTAVGFLLAAQAAGVGLGMTVLAARVPPQRRIRWMVPLSLAAAAPLMLTAFDPGLVLVGVLWAIAGAGSAYQLAANVAFVAAVPNTHRAQAFGLVGTGLAAGQGAAILAAGILAEHVGPAATVAVFGAAGTLAALALAPAARSVRDQAGQQVPS